MKTISAKSAEVTRKWYVADADGKVLGRFASEVARLLKGKHKPIYTPHVDTGDHVIVINAEKIRVTGNKLQDKIYTNYSGYPGGLRKRTLEKVLETRPEYALERAIKGMLPKNALGRNMMKKVRIYAGSEHNHASQQPEAIDI
jgi:large subunit ribosomal protein L13